MLPPLPAGARDYLELTWNEVEPFYRELESRPLRQMDLPGFLSDWSRVRELVSETYSRLYVTTTCDTNDQHAKQHLAAFLDGVFQADKAADQGLKQKLLDSGLTLPGFEMPLRNMQAETDLYRQTNLELLAAELKLVTEYDRIVGDQSVTWEGQEVTLLQLQPVLQEQDREKRERAWRLVYGRRLADREAISELWVRFMQVRRRMAANAGRGSFRDFRWQQLLRFDYSPQDCIRFHQAILQVAAPAAMRIYERRRQRLGLYALRPWDLYVDPLDRPPLRPFQTVAELADKTAAMFHRVAPQLGQYFERMRNSGLLDLENRKGKAPGGYCIDYATSRRPFIFMNAVNQHEDVQTLLHEGGHAFHVFETATLPYHQQLQVGMEFGEVASMGMEFLASPYLPASEGGFYSDQDARRARVEHLEQSILFWPYMALVDAFQHWAYENSAEAVSPANCDRAWANLWESYMPGVDWSGLEQEKVTGWQRQLHIHTDPFYFVEYGLAQLGAVQVWSNALKNQADAVEGYRRALSLGGTRPLPELYQAAGARFAFDASVLQFAIDRLEEAIAELDA